MTTLTPSKVVIGALLVKCPAIPEARLNPAPPQAYLSSSLATYCISEHSAFRPAVKWCRSYRVSKFPFATFTGKVNEVIDYTIDGTHQVTMTGKLSMHGVEVQRTINGTIVIAKGEIIMDSKFDVIVADHKIKVPSLYVAKIAEIINVTFHTEMTLKK